MIVLAAVLLGVVSRVEERSGVSVLSTDSAWVLAAFAVGVMARSAVAGAVRGVVFLTVANAAYYVWILLTEGSVVGHPAHWFVYGVGAGLVFGAAGWASRHGAPAAAALPLAVIATEVAGGPFAVLLP